MLFTIRYYYFLTGLRSWCYIGSFMRTPCQTWVYTWAQLNTAQLLEYYCPTISSTCTQQRHCWAWIWTRKVSFSYRAAQLIGNCKCLWGSNYKPRSLRRDQTLLEVLRKHTDVSRWCAHHCWLYSIVSFQRVTTKGRTWSTSCAWSISDHLLVRCGYLQGQVSIVERDYRLSYYLIYVSG